MKLFNKLPFNPSDCYLVTTFLVEFDHLDCFTSVRAKKTAEKRKFKKLNLIKLTFLIITLNSYES